MAATVEITLSKGIWPEYVRIQNERGGIGTIMRNVLRDNGLTLALCAMFLVAVIGMALTGQAAFNEELADQGIPAMGLLAYLVSRRHDAAYRRTAS